MPLNYYLCAVEEYEYNNSAADENKEKLRVKLFLEYSCKMNIQNVEDEAIKYFFKYDDLLISPWSDINVSAPKSKRNVLIRFSKYDMNLYTNIESDLLSFTYKANVWAKNTMEFCHCDPFVSEHRQSYRFLKEFLKDYRKPKLSSDYLKPMEVYYDNWSLDVVNWYNNKILNPKPRQKQMYIHGETCMGKSTFVRKLIGKAFLPYVFYPEKGQFFMQEFSQNRHKIIVFEEFDYYDFPLNGLKRLLAGEEYSYSVKGEKAINITFTGPIIFVSNFNEIKDKALLSRLVIVHANKCFWTDTKYCIPKIEYNNYDQEDNGGNDYDDDENEYSLNNNNQCYTIEE